MICEDSEAVQAAWKTVLQAWSPDEQEKDKQKHGDVGNCTL